MIEFRKVIERELKGDGLAANAPAATPLEAVTTFVSRLERIALKLRDQFTVSEREAIKAAILAVYDGFDIPVVSGVVETWLKAKMRSQVATVIDRALGLTTLSKATAVVAANPVMSGLASLAMTVLLAIATWFGCSGPPAPEPVKPDPVKVDPQPQPKPIVDRQVILFYDSDSSTPEEAAVIFELQTGDRAKQLAEHGHVFVALDVQEPGADGKQLSKRVAAWQGDLEGIALPALFIVEKQTNKLLGKQAVTKANLNAAWILEQIDTVHGEEAFAAQPFVDTDFTQWKEHFVAGDASDETFQRPRVDADGIEVFEELVPVVDRSQWDTIIASIERSGIWMDKLAPRIYDQKRRPSCTSNATAKATEIAEHKRAGAGAIIEKSAESLFARVQIGRGGSRVMDNITALSDGGILPLDTPANRLRFKHVMVNAGPASFPPNWQETAKLFRTHKWLEIRSFDGFLSALLRGYPVVYGRDGHAICACRVVKKDGVYYVKYFNSWTEQWGDHGFGYDSEAQIRRGATWAFALCSMIDPELDVVPAPKVAVLETEPSLALAP